MSVRLARWRLAAAAALLIAAGVVAIQRDDVRGIARSLGSRLAGSYTVAGRIEQLGDEVDARLRRHFIAARVTYPPREVAYVVFKDARVLEVYARGDAARPWTYIKEYPVLGASGGLGPKLAEGDNQVPEGIYAAESLNPNSAFHLSIRLDYPNDFDRRMAASDGRTRLGGDIMIHGGSSSVGCVAVGDHAIEELFILAARTPLEHVKIVISPSDLRLGLPPAPGAGPAWLPERYSALRSQLDHFHRLP